jgi:hypothetical protein
MVERAITFAVEKFCNYRVEVRSELNNEIILSVEEDVCFGEFLIKNERDAFTFHYFNGDNQSITVICRALFPFRLELIPEDIKIEQIYMTEHLKEGFYDRVKNSTPLRGYDNDYLPAIFYGIWSDEDLDTLRKNKSLKIIIWSGGDINAADYREDCVRERVLRNVSEIRALSKVIHISKSPFIAKSLEEFGIPYIETPFCPIDLDRYKPVKKGDSIYIYTAPGLESYYGFDLYDKVVEKYKDINFIFACCKAGYDFIKATGYQSKYAVRYYKQEELIDEVYSECFLALRLTTHDGIANTVQELGLMGIRSVHNGSSPSSLNYRTLEDLCRHIDHERETIGTCDEVLADEVRRYLTLDTHFYKTGFYRRRQLAATRGH